MKNFLTTKQVAQALGVSDASLKRWCDKGLIKTVRTGGGHRRLAINSVLDFLRERGYPVLRPELLGLPARVSSNSTTQDRTLEQITQALREGDEEQFRQINYNIYLGGAKVEQICASLSALFKGLLSENWRAGAAQRLQEKLACEICARWLHEMRHVIHQADAHAPLALGGALRGDGFQLPALMAELILQERGWRVAMLGNETTPETVIEGVQALAPQMVWLSVSTHTPGLVDAVQRIRQAVELRNGEVAVGGRGLTEELCGQLNLKTPCEDFKWLPTPPETPAEKPAA